MSTIIYYWLFLTITNKTSLKIKIHINIALGYFLIIAFLGVLLRLFFVANIPLNYKHIVHAHSHIALLGWIYTAITSLIYYCYLIKKPISKKYKTLFWGTQITIIGMLISFPLTGYALYSILFSTLFLIASYWFFWFISKHTSEEQKKTNSYKLIRTGLWFMVFSSLGPWALGIIMNTLGNTSIWYKNAIYFYLHFQYNGWFIVTLFGIFFYILEKQHIEVTKQHFKQFYWLLISSVIFTHFISVLWTKPPILFNFLGGLGSILQFISFGVLLGMLSSHRIALKSSFSPITSRTLKIVFVLFVLKMILQFLGTTTYFSDIVATHIDFAIGYLHWTFLGVVTIAILGFLHHFKLLVLSKRIVQIYMVGFILTEALIFYKGIISWLTQELFEDYYTLLTIASFLLLIAIIILLKHNTNTIQHSKSINTDH